MATRNEPWSHGTPCWVDLGVEDVDRARVFYEGLFGWDVEPGPPEAGGYAMCLKDGHPAAGIGPKQAADQPSVWITYLAADDADEVVAKLGEHGGHVLMEPMDVMDVGRMAIATDAAGAVFGIWQARAHHGVGIANEPGSLTWNEQMSRTFEQSKDFYGAVFGWGFEDMSGDGFEYATFTTDGNTAGGIGTLTEDVPAQVPAHWRTYFQVEDTDDALATVERLGGSVHSPPFDTPFGRMAAVQDDQGATFMVLSPVPAA